MSNDLWIVPCAVALLATAVALRGRSPTPGALLDGWIRALLVLGVTCALSVEALGAMHLLTTPAVRGFWLLAMVLSLAAAARRGPLALRDGWPDDGVARTAYVGVGTVLVATLAGALCAPPNTWDALTYHLPRVMHWLQNQSVEAFPTFNYKHVAYPPGSSYLVATTVALTGDDHLALLPQWLAFTGCLAAASRIARRAGGGDVGVALAALAVATMPMAIAQSMTAQNDLLVACWILAFAWCAARPDYLRASSVPWFAASAGLVLVTKPTGLLVLAPLAFMVALRTWRSPAFAVDRASALRAFLAQKGLAAGLAVALFAPHAVRSARVFGTPFHDQGDTKALAHGPLAALSTALRYLWLNVPSEGAWRAMLSAHRALLGDPFAAATTRASCVNVSPSFLAWRLWLPSEDYAGAPMQLAWLALAMTVVAVRRSDRRDLAARVLLAVATAAFAMFCVALKWQQWGNRLTLPIALVALVAVGTVSARLPRLAQYVLVLTALGAAGPHVLWQVAHPLATIPRSFVEPEGVEGVGPGMGAPSVLTHDREAVRFTHVFRGWDLVLGTVYDRLARHPAAWRFALVGTEDGLGEYFFWRHMRGLGRPFRIAHANPIAATQSCAPEVMPSAVDAVVILSPPMRVLRGPGLREAPRAPVLPGASEPAE